jgi:hypothetical protein
MLTFLPERKGPAGVLGATRFMRRLEADRIIPLSNYDISAHCALIILTYASLLTASETLAPFSFD